MHKDEENSNNNPMEEEEKEKTNEKESNKWLGEKVKMVKKERERDYACMYMCEMCMYDPHFFSFLVYCIRSKCFSFLLFFCFIILIFFYCYCFLR